MNPISAIADLLTTGIKALFPDKTVETQAVYALAGQIVEETSRINAAQSTTNTAEASTGSLFLAGWRPFIGWMCGAGMFYSMFLVPFTAFFVTMLGYHMPAVPTLSENIWQLTLGMLGMGGLRTIDKLTGSDTKAIGSLVSGIAKW